MAMIKCPGCGQMVSETVQECPECGNPLNVQSDYSMQNEEEGPIDSEDLSPEEVQIMKRNLIITGAHFAAVCIAALAVALIDKDYVIIGLPLGVIGASFIICLTFNLWNSFGKVFRIFCILGVIVCAIGFIAPRL